MSKDILRMIERTAIKCVAMALVGYLLYQSGAAASSVVQPVVRTWQTSSELLTASEVAKDDAIREEIRQSSIRAENCDRMMQEAVRQLNNLSRIQGEEIRKLREEVARLNEKLGGDR